MKRPGLACAALLAAACGRAAPPADDGGNAAAEIQALTVRYDSMIRRMQGDSIAALYAPDGEMLGPGLPAIRGPDSIRAFLGSFTGVRVDSERMTTVDIMVHGGDAVQWGTWRQAATVTGKPTANLEGRFVAQWTKGPDGQWRIRRMLTQAAPLPRSSP